MARSTFRSQNVQNTPFSDHFWKLRCRKSARRCGAKHISKSKCTKHTILGPLLEVAMSKKCMPLWREAHFEVKMYKTLHVRATFGGSDVEKVHAVVARSTFRSQIVKNTRGSDHFWRFRCRFPSLHYITLHYTPLHYAPLHYTTLHNTTTTTTQLHSTTLHYTKLHYTTLHYTPLHYITLHCTTFHYTSLHYTTLHYNATTRFPTHRRPYGFRSFSSTKMSFSLQRNVIFSHVDVKNRVLKISKTTSFFPTCQVRVVRFYVSCLVLLLLVLLLSLSSSSSCSTATRDPQCSLSDLNHDHPRPVFPAGPQPRPSTPSVPCRTSTTTIHAQCSLPDLNHDHPRPVFPAGPQPRVSMPSVPCRTSTASIHAKRYAT